MTCPRAPSPIISRNVQIVYVLGGFCDRAGRFKAACKGGLGWAVRDQLLQSGSLARRLGRGRCRSRVFMHSESDSLLQFRLRLA